MTLNNDLLWKIFMLNASDDSVDTNHRLSTTRKSSQVCRDWRNVIIGSTSIWGRLILIEDLYNVRWMQEVIGRAGSSLKWIKVDLSVIPGVQKRKAVLSLLFPLLEARWDQVECLELEIDYERSRNQGDMARIWISIGKPTTTLRAFKLAFRVSYKPHADALYSDSNWLVIRARQLHTFSCNFFNIPLSCTWLQGLVVLHFTPDSTKHAFDIISMTPVLQSLRIFFKPSGSANGDTFEHDLSLFSLPPRLSNFHAETTLSGFIDFWNNIIPPISELPCTTVHEIYIQLSDFRRIDNSTLTADAAKAMSNFIQFYNPSGSSSGEGTKLSMQFTKNDVSVEIQPYLRILFSANASWETFPPSFEPFLNDLLTPHFALSTHLTIRFDTNKPSSHLSSLQPWLLSLTSVKAISLNCEPGLECFTMVDKNHCDPGTAQSKQAPFFPSLTTLKVPVQAERDTDLFSLLLYLHRRRASKLPLPVVYIETRPDIAPRIRSRLEDLFSSLDYVLINSVTGETMDGEAIICPPKFPLVMGEEKSPNLKISLSIWKRIKAKILK